MIRLLTLLTTVLVFCSLNIAAAQVIPTPRRNVDNIGPNGPLFLTIQPASIFMQLVSGAPGDSLRASDPTSLLAWFDRRGGPMLDKITVGTLCLNQRYVLRVTSYNAVNGTPLATRISQDGLPDQDLILNIAHRMDGSAGLRYEVSASVGDGVGADVHTVTYTLTSQ